MEVWPTQLAQMSFDGMFDLAAVVVVAFYFFILGIYIVLRFFLLFVVCIALVFSVVYSISIILAIRKSVDV